MNCKTAELNFYNVECHTQCNECSSFIKLGIIFALLSSIRTPFLPEFQLLLFIVYALSHQREKFKVCLLLVTILCTHHYVIPDSVYRISSEDYPSIYTRTYGSIKLLDILIVFLFCYTLNSIIKGIPDKIFKIKGLPSILFVTSLFGLFFLNKNTFASYQCLFLIRSYLLFISIFCLSFKFNKQEYYNLSILVIICWTLKMILSILIPHEHPLYREILGLPGVIFFAGDEFLSLPYYFAILILLNRFINKRYLYSSIILIFILILIAQRKGGIPVMLGLFLLTYSYCNERKWLCNLVKLYYLFLPFATFTFLYFIKLFTSDQLVKLAFSEYSTFTNVALDSIDKIKHTNYLEYLFGISPVGKYEIIGLPNALDHFMAFGDEVGEKFRYQLWSFPLSRCFLNIGLIGFVYTIIYMVKSITLSLPHYYLVLMAIPVCYYTNLTPVQAFAMGIVFSFLYNYTKRFKKNGKHCILRQ